MVPCGPLTLIRSDDQEEASMADKRPPAKGQDKDSVSRSVEDEEVQAFAEKFNISLAMAKRLVELHRAALARELKKPKKR
jgi:ActR/RegA family two-component response regulator